MGARLDDRKARERLAKLLRNVKPGNRRRILAKIGEYMTRSLRSNITRERTYEGQSFRDTLAASTMNAIKSRQLTRGEGVSRRGKKLRTVRRGAHRRRGGGHVLRDTGDMYRSIGIASVNDRRVEVGMTDAMNAKKAAGHHFPNPAGSKRPPFQPKRGPVRKFIGVANRDWAKLRGIVERYTVDQPGVKAA